MVLSAIQTRPKPGDIDTNIANHVRIAAKAIEKGGEFLVFPELSLSGYEPAMAATVSMRSDDKRLEVFQQFSDRHGATIGVGAPLRTSRGIEIGMVIFQPHEPRVIYSKRHLHKDEEQFFVPGVNHESLLGFERDIAVAICYEISVPQHAADASRRGARTYFASVAKTAHATKRARETLVETASTHGMLVVMANCVGPGEEGICTGQSACWNEHGQLLSDLGHEHEGIVMIDTKTRQAVSHSW